MYIIAQLEELRAEDQLIREKYEEEIEDLKQRCEEKNREVDVHRLKFVEFKHQVALNALNSRSGKPIPPKVKIEISISCLKNVLISLLTCSLLSVYAIFTGYRAIFGRRK